MKLLPLVPPFKVEYLPETLKMFYFLIYFVCNERRDPMSNNAYYVFSTKEMSYSRVAQFDAAKV